MANQQTNKPKNRGTRNNNWLNVRAPSNKYWVGQTGRDDKGFAIFSDPVYSLRAGFRLFNTYKLKYGINTIRGIIYRFAPPNENDTDNYVNYVSQKTGLDPDRFLTESDWPNIITYMAKMETQNLPDNNLLLRAENLA